MIDLLTVEASRGVGDTTASDAGHAMELRDLALRARGVAAAMRFVEVSSDGDGKMAGGVALLMEDLIETITALADEFSSARGIPLDE